MDYKTEQEAFWAGDFGSEYMHRNVGATLLSSNLAFFSRILRRTGGVTSIVELGANVGMNLRALRQLLPNTSLAAVEINANAAASLREWGECEVHEGSLLDYEADRSFEMSFCKGVLIHIAPEALSQAYNVLYRSSHRYILLAEYYNPSPLEVTYRGHAARLFKRDFAGEFLDQYPDVLLRDYGFVYRRDPSFPQDDLTWFLLEKIPGRAEQI